MSDPCRALFAFAPQPRTASAPLALLVREPEAPYSPRHPERTALYRLFDRHFDEYARIHEERFERASGALRAVVPRTVEAYLDCAALIGAGCTGASRACAARSARASTCWRSPAIRLRQGFGVTGTRNFCPSCQAKRAALFAEKLQDEILAPVPHRHVVFTIPKALRGLFERERKLLGLLPRCAFGAVRRLYQEHFDRRDALPGMVASIQTFGSALNFHPHVHALVTDGMLEEGGGFLPLAAPDFAALNELFRRLVLAELVRSERLNARVLRMQWLQCRTRCGALGSGGGTAAGSSSASVVDRSRLEALRPLAHVAPFGVQRVRRAGGAAGGVGSAQGARRATGADRRFRVCARRATSSSIRRIEIRMRFRDGQGLPDLGCGIESTTEN